MSVSYDFGVGGYDLTMTIPELSSGQWVGVKSDIGITTADVENPSTAFNTVRIGKDSGGNYVSILNKSGSVVEKYTSFQNFGTVRVVFHNEFVTVYVDQTWVHTFCLDAIYHPEKPIIELVASGNITVTNICLKELSDWREAIFIDMETDSMNAIASVILQRPVDIRPTWFGGIAFEYDPIRSTVMVDDAREIQYALTESRQGCSDAIAYFTKVAVTVDPDYAEQFGFVTRMYRLPDLDNGAIRAAKVMQRRSRESAYPHSVRSRIRPELETGDILRLQVAPVDGSAPIDKPFIVESIRFQISDGGNTMTAEGRAYGV